MVKMTGALLIAVVCAYYGFISADRLKRRRDFLTAFVTSLSILETEICFGKYDLKSVFKRIDDKKLFNLYTDCAEHIIKSGIKQAWKNSVTKAAPGAGLKMNDTEAVLSLGAELGMSDIEGQKKAIARTHQLTLQCSAEADEEYLRLGRVYQKCGVLAGVFVFIMFL